MPDMHLLQNSQLYRRRGPPYRTLELDLGPRHAGDFHVDEEEDPRRRGILPSTNCRRHRDRLRSSRQSHILQGFSVIAAVLVVLLLLIFLGSEMHSEQEQQQPSLWTSALRLVGLEEADPAGESFLKSKDIAGSDSCSPEALDLRRIFRLMGQAVLNQEQALARMERALAGSEQFHSVALLGPPGVGKSLAANALRQNFPWPTNAHAYSWNTRVTDEVMKFRLVRQFAEGLSDCGANLLIIDNLATCDHGLVPIYNRLIREREGEPDRNQTVLVVYVFTLETDMYWEQFELLQQQLPAETTIVSFRFFARDDLLDCLANELQAEQRYLSEEKVSLVLAEAMRDVHEMGCKSLRRLIFEHGVPCVRKPR